MKPIRILVVDDQRSIRESIFRLLSQTRDILVAGEAHNGVEVLEKVRAYPYDVVLLDIEMPGKGGLEVLSELKREKPDLPIVILTIHPGYVDRAMELGATAYLMKDRAADELVSTIRKAAPLV